MGTGRITKRTVDAVTSHGADAFLWDDARTGSGLKGTRGGAKTYLVQYRLGGRGVPTRRFTIGRHGSPWTPSAARSEAERLLTQIARGDDPRFTQAERERAHTDLAFDRYVERYLQEHGEKRWRPKTLPTVASNLRRYVMPVLGTKPLPLITRQDLVAIFDALPPGKPALPRNVYAHASRVFSWAVERGDLDRSPFEGFKAVPPVPSRERVLSDQELRRVWEATESLGYPFGPMIRLLLLTGQRREEVAALNWTELDRSAAEWVLPGLRSKNGKVHVVPLAVPAVDLLDALAGSTAWPRSGLIFTTTGKSAASGHSRAKARLDALMVADDRSTIAAWRVHDLRRTVATGLQRLGVRFEVTEAILNHVSGSRSGVAGVYQRHGWRDEKRTALASWAHHVLDLVLQGEPDAASVEWVAERAADPRADSPSDRDCL